MNFPRRLHDMVTNAKNNGFDTIVSWNENGTCFRINTSKENEFVNHVLPVWFRLSKWSSFQRQLNIYGFQRICHTSNGDCCNDTATDNLANTKCTGRRKKNTKNGQRNDDRYQNDATYLYFYHKLFQRDSMHLVYSIERVSVTNNRKKGQAQCSIHAHGKPNKKKVATKKADDCHHDGSCLSISTTTRSTSCSSSSGSSCSSGTNRRLQQSSSLMSVGGDDCGVIENNDNSTTSTCARMPMVSSIVPSTTLSTEPQELFCSSNNPNRTTASSAEHYYIQQQLQLQEHYRQQLLGLLLLRQQEERQRTMVLMQQIQKSKQQN